MESIAVGFVHNGEAYTAEMRQIFGNGADKYALRIFRNGGKGMGWYSLGQFWKEAEDKWIFATPKGRYPEIAAQLIKYLK